MDNTRLVTETEIDRHTCTYGENDRPEDREESLYFPTDLRRIRADGGLDYKNLNSTLRIELHPLR